MDATIITAEIRIAIMARMVLTSQNKKIGRTQLMKLCYFLQEIEQVPTIYDFRLFNYGPFDPEVLSDLGTSCSQNALEEQTVAIKRGYRYEITPGKAAEQISKLLTTELALKVERIVRAFVGDGSGELELKSTILFVDREFARENTTADLDTITERVRNIKPHFGMDAIRTRIASLKSRGFLKSILAD